MLFNFQKLNYFKMSVVEFIEYNYRNNNGK